MKEAFPEPDSVLEECLQKSDWNAVDTRLHELAEAVASRADLVRFVGQLSAYVDPSSENVRTEHYLNALWGVLVDHDGSHASNPWSDIATCLLGALIYE